MSKFEEFQRSEYKQYLVKNQNDAVNSSDSDDEYSDEDDETFLVDYPISHCFSFNVNEDENFQFDYSNNPKAITSIASNESGTHFAVGLNHSTVKVYGFNRIFPRSEHNYPIRSIEMFENCKVNKVLYQPKSNNFLCITSDSKFKLFTENGAKSTTFYGGDRYFFDLKNTIGHVSGINDCDFDPSNTNLFATGSSDEYIRIWDVENYEKLGKSRDVIHVKEKVENLQYKPQKSNSTGTIITFGSSNELKVFDDTRVCQKLGNAVQSKAAMTCLQFSNLNDNVFVTRATDCCVKTYDLRNFIEPVSIRENFETSKGANCIFSNDDKYIFTGSGNAIHILNSTNLKTEFIILNKNEARIFHQNFKINQIFCGSTDGTLQINFSHKISFNGALDNISKERGGSNSYKRQKR